jgi:hypothetical protein
VDQTALASTKEKDIRDNKAAAAKAASAAASAVDVQVKMAGAADAMMGGNIKGLEVAEEAACESCSA